MWLVQGITICQVKKRQEVHRVGLRLKKKDLKRLRLIWILAQDHMMSRVFNRYTPINPRLGLQAKHFDQWIREKGQLLMQTKLKFNNSLTKSSKTTLVLSKVSLIAESIPRKPLLPLESMIQMMTSMSILMIQHRVLDHTWKFHKWKNSISLRDLQHHLLV